MKRTGRAAGSVAVLALLIAACGGSSGSKTLSEDDFIDELNSICKSADRAINRLDVEDRDFFDDVIEVMQGGADELAELKPPKDFENDFNDFADNLDDTIKAAEDLRDAVEDEDDDAIADADDELTTLGEDANDLADDLGAEDCIDIGFDTGDTPDTTPDTTADTTPDTTDDTTDDSTDDTTDNTTANTPLPIDTTIPTVPPSTSTATTTPPTAPPMTSPTSGGDGLAQDAANAWSAPAGWTFQPNDPADAITPFGDPVLGAVVTDYWVGFISNDATGQEAFMYISKTTSEWTAEQVEAIWTFEAVGRAADTTTPLGLPARIAVGLGDQGQFDVGVAILATNSIAIFTTTGGTDMATLLDDVFTANSMGS